MKTMTFCKSCVKFIEDKNCRYVRCSECPFMGEGQCKFDLIVKAGKYLFEQIKEHGWEKTKKMEIR